MLKLTPETSVIEFINKILTNAITKRSSDIHFEPYHEFCRIRFRIDGMLYETLKTDLVLWQQLCTRLKIMGNLNIAEKRHPQDGSFAITIGNLKRSCRISTCPTVFGEKLAVRILSHYHSIPTINQLGLADQELSLFNEHLQSSHGIILVTGPTGSGKSTTLYSAINFLNDSTKNISTAEDPVEINLAGVNQVEINHKIGLDFATVLRAFLRQDPDVIMIGEIRDLETAQIAIRAAHTGHLVFATLHTTSAISSINRLLNMGIPAFNLASSLKLVIAQRLIRILCDHCKQQIEVPNNFLKQKLSLAKLNHHRIYTAVGCQHCQHGYWDRKPIFEMVPITPVLSSLIIDNFSSSELSETISKMGYHNLKENGLINVANGITSYEEYLRVMH